MSPLPIPLETKVDDNISNLFVLFRIIVIIIIFIIVITLHN